MMKDCICCHEIASHTLTRGGTTVYCCDGCHFEGCTEKECFRKGVLQIAADIRVIEEARRNRCPVCAGNSTMCGCWDEEEVSA